MGERASHCWRALLLGALLLPGPAAAEVVVDPRIGFRGVFQLGRPFPVEIELYNAGRAIDGVLELQVWKGGPTKGGSPYPFIYRREVFLASQARKTLQLTVDPDFISRPLRVSFSSPAGKTVREVDLRRHFSPVPVALLLSEAAVPPSIPAGKGHRLVSVTLAELPADPRALLGVSAVIFYEQPLRELSRAQSFALDTWLAAGGRMLILASLNAAIYQEANISRFLPVRVSGVKKIRALEGMARVSGNGGAVFDSIAVQDARVTTGRALIEHHGSPILVTSERGKGRIDYLALDVGRPPAAQWEKLPGLFQDILGQALDGAPATPAYWDESVFFRLFTAPSFMGTYVPTASLFAALSGYLGAVFLFAWLWQRRRIARARLAAGGAAGILFAAIGGYLFFSRGGNIPDGVLVSSTVLDNVAPGYVEAQSNIALFSTQHRAFSLEVAPGWLEMMPVPARSKVREEPLIVAQSDGASNRFRFPLREWDYRLLKLRFVERFPFFVSIENPSGKARLTINNQSGQELSDCWLILPGQRYSLGDIPRGASWQREFSAGEALPESRRSEAADFRDVSFKEKSRDLLFHASFFPREVTISRSGPASAVFLGWVKQPKRRVWVDDSRIWTYEYALFRLIVPLPAEDDT